MNFWRKDANHQLVSRIQFIQYVCVHLSSVDYASIDCSSPDLNYPPLCTTTSNFPQATQLEADFIGFVSIS